jgi:hypothetical protein
MWGLVGEVGGMSKNEVHETITNCEVGDTKHSFDIWNTARDLYPAPKSGFEPGSTPDLFSQHPSSSCPLYNRCCPLGYQDTSPSTNRRYRQRHLPAP